MHASVRRYGAVLLSIGMLALGGCHRSAAESAAADRGMSPAATALTALRPAQDTAAAGEEGSDKDREESPLGLKLTSQQIAKLGITTEQAQTTEHRGQTAGYGAVISHDIIAQAAADLITAEATEKLSRSALARAQRLRGTAGAVSQDVEELAVQKAEIDAATLMATRQKLAAVFGMNPPWKRDDRGDTVQGLASGRIKLLRVTFPLGALPDGVPATLQVARIGAAVPQSFWTSKAVWDAPADGAVPGRSFFALLQSADLHDGERLQVLAPIGKALQGVIVPAAAVVLSEGEYWCYIEREPGAFTRIRVDTTMPVANGYFVSSGVQAGDPIVTSAVAFLLAKQTGAAAEPD